MKHKFWYWLEGERKRILRARERYPIMRSWERFLLCEGEENLCVQKRFLASKLNALPNSGSLESIRFHHHHHFNGWHGYCRLTGVRIEERRTGTILAFRPGDRSTLDSRWEYHPRLDILSWKLIFWFLLLSQRKNQSKTIKSNSWKMLICKRCFTFWKKKKKQF